MNNRVFIAIPIHRAWQKESMESVQNAIKASKYCKITQVFKLYEESLIQRARHKCMEAFLASKDDYLFFIDDDVVLFQENAIDQLVSNACDIVGAPTVTKRYPFLPNFYPFQDKYPDFRVNKGIFEVRYVATSCCLYSRAVCQELYDRDKYPFNCFVKDLGGGKGEVLLSEDWSFCQNALQKGYKCYIDPKVEVGHLGLYAYTMDDYYSILEKEGLKL